MLVGIVGLLAFASLVVLAIQLGLFGRLFYRQQGGELASLTLLGAWPTMFVVGAFATLCFYAFPARPPGMLTDELTAALRRDAAAHRHWQLDRLRRVEQSSFGLPIMAIALLAPLTLHLGVALLLGGRYFKLREFDGYMALALGCVWLPHLVAAGLSWRFVRQAREQLSRGETLHPVLAGVQTTALAAASTLISVLIVAMVARMPLMLGILIAAVIVLVTGLAYLPLLYWRMTKKLQAERALIAALTPPPSGLGAAVACFAGATAAMDGAQGAETGGLRQP